MSQRKKAVFNWSGGKDAALALTNILNDPQFDIVSLLTTVNEDDNASSIHSIPSWLLSKQADSIGLPLHTVPLQKTLKNHNVKIRSAVEHFKKQGVTHFIFGDLFLREVRKYREDQLNPLGIEVVEPLWGKTSTEIMQDFLHSGIQAKIIVTQADKLDCSFVGKRLNRNTINAFPENIDICGENGEYHTLSYAGGAFQKEIDFSIARVHKVSYDIGTTTKQTQTYQYWQAEIHRGKR